MNIKCPNCDAEILRVVVDGKDVECALRPTDSEMLDWLGQALTIEIAYQVESDFIDDKRCFVFDIQPSDRKPIREAIAAAMREAES